MNENNELSGMRKITCPWCEDNWEDKQGNYQECLSVRHTCAKCARDYDISSAYRKDHLEYAMQRLAPLWCTEPYAVKGSFCGCWSLYGEKVKSDSDCETCEFSKENVSQKDRKG